MTEPTHPLLETMPDVLPVVDLLDGRVVRGVAGERSRYQPVQSVLCRDSTPQTVGQALVERLACREVYVADLDAVAGGEPAWSEYRTLNGLGLSLWIDAGVGDFHRLRRLLDFAESLDRPTTLIVGGESLADFRSLQGMVETAGADRLAFSLDLKHGRPLLSQGVRNGGATKFQTAKDVAQAGLEAGVQRWIVLDLAQVGVGRGVGTEPLCRWLVDQRPGIEVAAGGGVRGPADMAALAQAGCRQALIASALHDGRLTRCSGRWIWESNVG